MQNFVKISYQIKKFSIQRLNPDNLVGMAAICYSAPISAVSICEQLLEEKKMSAKFQVDILKTEGVRVYTNHLPYKYIL